MKLDALRDLHFILRPYDNICPRDCFLCEDYETAILLPNEEKLISIHPEFIKDFIKHEDGFYYLDANIDCPYFLGKEDKVKCLIYNERPIDCRIFPFYPRFNLETNSYSLLKSETYCTISRKDFSKMEQDVRKVLDLANEFVPKSWKKIYNELNYQRLNGKSCKFESVQEGIKVASFKT